MTLLDLDAQFLHYTSDTGFRRIDGNYADADGILFLCPQCYLINAEMFAGREDLGCPPGHYGTHSVICWCPRVPQSCSPGPGRWNMVGTGLHDLTLTAGSSSVQLLGGDDACEKCGRKGACRDATCNWCPCRAHFYVRNGAIEFC